MNSPHTYIFAAASCIFVLCLGVATYDVWNVEWHARTLSYVCRESPDPTVCYQSEGSKLHGAVELEKIFLIIERVRELDVRYKFCHLWGHRLGELTALENPDAWANAFALNPKNGMCSNGFIHGLIIGRFRTDTLSNEEFKKMLPEFRRACAPRSDWRPSSLDRAMCYHGMGHLFMFVTRADTGRAVDMCQSAIIGSAAPFFTRCLEGVFMQIYQPVEPDDFDLLTYMDMVPTKETYRIFCSTQQDPMVVGACLREAFALFREDVAQGTHVESFCAGQPSGEVRACYETVSSIIGRVHLSVPEEARAACMRLGDWSQECFGRVALAYIEEDREDQEGALSFCLNSPNSFKEQCLSFLFSLTDFVYQRASDRDRLCSTLERLSGGDCTKYYTQ